MIFTIILRPTICLLLLTTIGACSKPGTLNTEPLVSMEMLLTGPSFGPSSGSASVTYAAGGWECGNIRDLERCGVPMLSGMTQGGRTRWPSTTSAPRQGACQGLPVLPHTPLPLH